MGEPNLDVTYPTETTDWQPLFWKRLSISLFAADKEFDAWKLWIETDSNGASDGQKWFAHRYSGYVLGLKYQNTSALVETVPILGSVPTYWDAANDKNGFCIEDGRVNEGYGGFCLFPRQTTNADGSAA